MFDPPGPREYLPLNILLVEDDPRDAELSRLELERLGHSVSVAGSGEEALQRYPSLQPDLVVTDITLPGLDGFELTRSLKALEHPQWLPVLFMSGARSDTALVDAYRSGADDFIHKPVNPAIMQAKLQVFRQRLQLQRQGRDRERLLQRYLDRVEEEKVVALHLMQRLVSAERLGDTSVSHWMRPAETYSGDLLAAARTPGGVLHVLLADATGHGLAASLAVMPVTQPFYRMTEKGFGIDVIAREMNRKVGELLPVGRFVAATLAAIDPEAGAIQVWNGGNPPPLLVDGPRHAAASPFVRAHLPLGILGNGEFDAATEVRAITAPGQLLLYSDGVLEAENRCGQAFGRERLLAALQAREEGAGLAGVVRALDLHLEGSNARDDLSLLLVDCAHQANRRPRPASGAGREDGACRTWRIALSLAAEDLRRQDPIPVLMGMLSQFSRDREHGGRIFVILSELYNNALDHGVLGLDSRLKAEPRGFERYLEERAVRLAALEAGSVEVEMSGQLRAGRQELEIRVRDSGPGFDHAGGQGRDAAGEGELPHGRGIALVRSLCSTLHYCGAGNEAVAYYDMNDCSPSDAKQQDNR